MEPTAEDIARTGFQLRDRVHHAGQRSSIPKTDPRLVAVGTVVAFRTVVGLMSTGEITTGVEVAWDGPEGGCQTYRPHELAHAS